MWSHRCAHLQAEPVTGTSGFRKGFPAPHYPDVQVDHASVTCGKLSGMRRRLLLAIFLGGVAGGPRARRSGARPGRPTAAAGRGSRSPSTSPARRCSPTSSRASSGAPLRAPARRRRLLRRPDDVLGAAARGARARPPPPRRARRSPMPAAAIGAGLLVALRRRSARAIRGGRPVTALLWIGVGLLSGAGAVAALRAPPAPCRRAGRASSRPARSRSTSSARCSSACCTARGVGGDTPLLLGTALLGSFTTFSTWMVESERLAGEGETRSRRRQHRSSASRSASPPSRSAGRSGPRSSAPGLAAAHDQRLPRACTDRGSDPLRASR